MNALGRDVSSDETSNSVYIVSWMKDPINYFYVLFTTLPSQAMLVQDFIIYIYFFIENNSKFLIGKKRWMKSSHPFGRSPNLEL